MPGASYTLDPNHLPTRIQPKTIWITERFNARTSNTLAEARRSVPDGSHSTAAAEDLLQMVNREKLQCTSIMSDAIDGSWIAYANAMGLKYQQRNTPESRQIVTISDLRWALRDVQDSELPAALYFITGYTRDVLYSQVLWGITHQAAVEDYVMDRMHAGFSTTRANMKPGHKTCVAQLYAQIYNRKRMKLQRAVLPDNTTLSVGRDGVGKNRNWKRPKHMFFVTTTQVTDGNPETVLTRMVSCTCDTMFP